MYVCKNFHTLLLIFQLALALSFFFLFYWHLIQLFWWFQIVVCFVLLRLFSSNTREIFIRQRHRRSSIYVFIVRDREFVFRRRRGYVRAKATLNVPTLQRCNETQKESVAASIFRKHVSDITHVKQSKISTTNKMIENILVWMKIFIYKHTYIDTYYIRASILGGGGRCRKTAMTSSMACWNTNDGDKSRC